MTELINAKSSPPCVSPISLIMEPVARLMDTWAGGRRPSASFPAVDDTTLSAIASNPVLPKNNAPMGEPSPQAITAMLTDGDVVEDLLLPPLYQPAKPPVASPSSFSFQPVRSLKTDDEPMGDFLSSLIASQPPSLSDVVSPGQPSSLVSALTGTPPSLERALYRTSSSKRTADDAMADSDDLEDEDEDKDMDESQE